jgi:hypothetical protein
MRQSPDPPAPCDRAGDCWPGARYFPARISGCRHQNPPLLSEKASLRPSRYRTTRGVRRPVRECQAGEEAPDGERLASAEAGRPSRSMHQRCRPGDGHGAATVRSNGALSGGPSVSERGLAGGRGRRACASKQDAPKGWRHLGKTCRSLEIPLRMRRAGRVACVAESCVERRNRGPQASGVGPPGCEPNGKPALHWPAIDCQSETGRTLTACKPLGPRSTSKSTLCPSCRLR